MAVAEPMLRLQQAAPPMPAAERATGGRISAIREPATVAALHSAAIAVDIVAAAVDSAADVVPDSAAGVWAGDSVGVAALGVDSAEVVDTPAADIAKLFCLVKRP